MSTLVLSTRSIGLGLTQTDLYPPLLSSAPALVGFMTDVSPGDDIVFTLVANGVPGVPAGIELRPGSSAGGLIWVHPGFISTHSGSWPVQLMLQASRQSEVIDTATLWLHDTRTMQVHRVAGELVPNPINASDTASITVLVRATFYDRSGLLLPRDEVPWSVTLPDSPPGFEVDGASIRIAPGTPSGETRVLISEPSGVAQTLILALLPAIDIGLELSQYNVYPPVRWGRDTVHFITALPPEAPIEFDYRLNGEDGNHAGIYMRQIGLTWGLFFHPEFLESYGGSFPAVVVVSALLDGQLAGQRTLYVHDTRTMVCTRTELDLRPSEDVEIPADDVKRVMAVPRFYDAHGISLPMWELDWEVVLENEPVPGIERQGQLLTITSMAAPGTHRVSLLGPDEHTASKFLTLR